MSNLFLLHYHFSNLSTSFSISSLHSNYSSEHFSNYGRVITQCSVAMTLFIIIFLVNLTICSSYLPDSYSTLVNTPVGVILHPLQIVGNFSKNQPVCTFTIHKNTCTSPPIRLRERVNWDTRLCFKWNCKTDGLAMRIENCWAGSPTNPLTIINDNGCTTEQSIINSPKYEKDFLRATSIGYLAVRHVGIENIDVGCRVSFCDYCDMECHEYTPPRSCIDIPIGMDFERMWNESKRVQMKCIPPTTPNTLNSSKSLQEIILNLYCLNVLLFYLLLR